jgi:hypothetical protein
LRDCTRSRRNIGIGVTVCRATTLPKVGHDTREELDKICALEPEFEEMCERLDEIAQDLDTLINKDINTPLPRPGGKGQR